MAILQIVQTVFYFDMMTKVAPNALKFIDPSWDNASPDGRLYPAYFYWFIDLRGYEIDSVSSSSTDEGAQVNPDQVND